jgi:hypothetical protein
MLFQSDGSEAALSSLASRFASSTKPNWMANAGRTSRLQERGIIPMVQMSACHGGGRRFRVYSRPPIPSFISSVIFIDNHANIPVR